MSKIIENSLIKKIQGLLSTLHSLNGLISTTRLDIRIKQETNVSGADYYTVCLPINDDCTKKIIAALKEKKETTLKELSDLGVNLKEINHE